MRYVYVAVALVALVAALGVLRLVTLQDRGGRATDGESPGYVRSSGGTLSSAYLSVRLSASADVLAPGGEATLIADVTPKRNMHVYAPGQDGYIPISLALNHSNAFRTEPPEFPAAEPYFFAPLKETVQVFGKPFRITSVLTIGRSPEVDRRAAAGDTVRVAGRLTYQACDDAVCYRSETMPVAWTVRLRK